MDKREGLSTIGILEIYREYMKKGERKKAKAFAAGVVAAGDDATIAAIKHDVAKYKQIITVDQAIAGMAIEQRVEIREVYPTKIIYSGTVAGMPNKIKNRILDSPMKIGNCLIMLLIA